MRTGILFLALCLLAPVAPAGRMGALTDGLAQLPESRWTLDAAAHLLRRAGFGGTPAEVRALHASGLRGAVDQLLTWGGSDPDVPRIDLSVTSRPGREMLVGKTQEERQKITREYRRRDFLQVAILREWWMQTMARTAHPMRERLTLFWHGHFTSGHRDVRNSYHMYIQNTLFRRHAAGNFRTLLHAVSRNPAMLEYLDNNRNRKGQPNENYAREVMELFTLGVGNYTESDIKELARGLTGWTFAGNRFYFDERQHDAGRKTFLGKTGNFTGGQMLDLILEQPAARRYLAARLFRYFVHDWPAETDIKGLARTLKRANFELRPMLRQLLMSSEFYSTRAVATKIKGPVELLVSTYRGLGMDPRGAPGLSMMAASLGQNLMDPPNVKGWPGGREWITTSMLLNRYNLLGAVVGMPEDLGRTLKNQKFRGAGAMMMTMGATKRRYDPNGELDEVMGVPEDVDAFRKKIRRDQRKRRGRVPTYNVLEQLHELNLTKPGEIVDYFTGALLSVPATPEMRRTFLDHLVRDGGFQFEDFRDAKSRLHGLLRLIVSTPEFQLT